MSNYLLKNITSKIGSGATPSGGQNAYQSEGISLIRSQNVYDFNFLRKGLAFINEDQARELNNVTVYENDILLNITGDSIARVCKVPINVLPARVNQHVAIIRANEYVDSDYLLCYLVNLKPYLLKICGVGGTRNALTKVAIEKLIVNLPEFKIQKNIGSLIRNINAKIELNNRINAELEAMAKTLYDYWFVQFDFPANLTGLQDLSGLKPYKTSGGKMVWNKELKREIPEGWEVGSLLNLGEIIGGSTPPREVQEYFTQNGTPWITPKDLSMNRNNKFISNGELDVSDKGVKAASLNVMPVGTIMLSTRAPIGYLAISRKEVTTNQGFKSFVPNKGYSTEYTYYTIKNLIPTIENNAVGSTFKEISAATLKSIPIFLPKLEIMEIFTKKAQSIFQRQNTLELENQQLTELRDWLLPMLMNGQVTVNEAKEYTLHNETLSMVAEGE